MTLTELRKLALAATPGPYTAELVQADTPAEPDIWRVYGADDSYEATICECWTGEQNNGAQARYIAALSPERILSMLAVIEAAKAYFGQSDELEAEAAFHEALAKLEGMK